MLVVYNNVEQYVMQLLQRIDIYHPHQLNAEEIAGRLGLSVAYLQFESACIDGHIFLDSRKDDTEQWEDFGHELCHALWHAGDQAVLPITMREYQEWRANSFALNFCIPSFMLDRLQLPAYEHQAVWMLMEKFGVSKGFAEKRLSLYLRKMYSRQY